MISAAAERVPAQGSVRAVRAVLFAGSAVGLSLVAHVTAGGAVPSLSLVLGLVLLTSAGATLLAGRRRGHLSIASVLMSLQVLLHYTFMVFATTTTCHLPSAAGGHHAGGSARAATTMTSAGCTAADSAAGAAMTSMTSVMLVGHVLAAGVLALLLSHGERALWWFLTWFLPSLPTPLTPSFVPAVSGPVALRASIRPQRGLLTSGVGRRGPPPGHGVPA